MIDQVEFFKRDAATVAADLLGCILSVDQGRKQYTIVETEAYYHEEKDDRGKHLCYGAKYNRDTATKATKPLFSEPGTWCIYGGQLLLSVTTTSFPDNVLIKAIQDTSGHIYGPHKMACLLHLYRKDPEFTDLHGKFSITDTRVSLTIVEPHAPCTPRPRVRVHSTEALNFKYNPNNTKLRGDD